MIELDRRNGGEAFELSGLNPTMPGNGAIIGVYKHGRDEPVLP